MPTVLLVRFDMFPYSYACHASLDAHVSIQVVGTTRDALGFATWKLKSWRQHHGLYQTPPDIAAGRQRQLAADKYYLQYGANGA